MVAVAVEELDGLLVVTGEHYLGSAAHSQTLLVLVEGLGREDQRLLEQELVDRRQYRRVEPHRVFDQQEHLHADFVDVVGVFLVFDKLDNGQQQVHVAEPAEDVVDMAQVGVAQTPRHLLREGREHDDGYVGAQGLDSGGALDSLVNVYGGHGDDDVEVDALYHLERRGGV